MGKFTQLTLLIIVSLTVFLMVNSKGFIPEEKRWFDIYWFNSSPDGFERQVLGINGQFPCPLIRAKKGDLIDVSVRSDVEDSGMSMTDIHWHGMFQKGSLLSDGVSGVTQCPIHFKETYRYTFEAKQTGTYWYHSHMGLQLSDGLKGALIIDDPNDPFLRPFDTCVATKRKEYKIGCSKFTNKLFYVDHSKIDIDRQPDAVIQLSDWFHKLADVLAQEVLFDPATGGMEPIPDSAVINGVGDYKCKAPNCDPFYTTNIAAGRAKKFRIINTSNMAVFTFAIEGHVMYIVEADGVTLDGTTKVDYLRINAGQRYSVIVKANKKAGNYWIRMRMDKNIYMMDPTNWNPDAFGILSYTTPSGKKYSKTTPSEANFLAMNALLDISETKGQTYIDMKVPLIPFQKNLPPLQATKTFTLNLTPIVGTNGVTYLGFNNILYKDIPETTMLGLILNNQDYTKTVVINGTQQGYNPYTFKEGDIVDVIVNNYDGGEHPLHIHGRNVWVMHTGKSGDANYVTNNKNPFPYNPNAPIRDTWSVNANSVIVFRFVADNPGIWMFHCHIDWHLTAGLMLTFVEDVDRIRELYGQYKDKVTHCH